MTDNENQDEVKVGARNSRADAVRLQAAHDALVEAGATCGRKMLDEIDPDEVLVSPSNELKSYEDLGGNKVKVQGYLIRFTRAGDYDLTGDRFSADTDFGVDFEAGPVKSFAWFNHCQPVSTAKGMVAIKRRYQDVELTKDDFGVLLQGILDERSDYEKFVAELARAGKMGLSSGTAGHLVERVPEGKGSLITRWILGADASYTHQPAESRNNVVPLKSLIPTETKAAETAVQVAENKHTPKKEPEMADISFTAEEIAALKESMSGLEAGMESLTKSIGEMKKAQPAAVNAGAVVVTKDATEQPFKNQGEFFQAVKNAAVSPMQEDPRLKPLKAAGLSEGVPADGGYLLQSQTAAGIHQNMFDMGAIMSRVSMTNVSSNGMIWNIIDETSRASSRFGGIVGYWLAEAGTKAASQPKFKQLELKLKKVAAVCYATDELLADATALNSWLTTNVPDELRFQTEAAFVYGDGVGKPQGIVGAPGTVSVTRVDGNKITLADVVAMYARRLGNGNFAWLINRDAMPQLMQLGSTYQFTWMPPGGMADSPYARLLGFPVIETEYNSTLGTVGDIILADLSKYQAIQKAGVETATSIHVKFLTDETAFRFVYRVDGAPMLSAPITPHKGSNTLSPFVTLTSAT